MTETGETNKIHAMTGAELDRLMTYYINTGKQLRANTLREMFKSVFTFKHKDAEKAVVLPGALAGSTR